MKFSLPTLGAVFLAFFSLARAQDEGPQAAAAQPDEVITDFGIEEYIAVPKFSLSIGSRTLSGAKMNFTGRGFVSSFQPTGDITSSGIVHIYHDGNVLLDTEPYSFTQTRSDGTSTVYTSPQTPAGFTNTFTFLSASQERPDGNIDFHSYTADVVDSGLHEKNPGTGFGMEIVVARDMGNLGKHFEWKLLFGTSLTGIKSHTSDTLNALITTTTDTYLPDLNGQTSLPANLPYTAPSFRQVNRVDVDGNPILDSTGANIIDYVETTIFLSDHPFQRTITMSPGTVFTEWDMKGAYFTFRLGPSISYLIGDRFRFTLSAGPALVYSGTQYTVTQTYIPDTADALVSTAESDETKFLLGYFVDATLQFDFTERAGIYAGAVYQDTGSYVQSADLNDTATGSHASFKSAVDLSKLSGFRMGVTFKF